jgi:small glutamine-rich tetratricopeptide repeat-containing protein alpha
MKNDLAAAEARIPAEDVTGTGDVEEVSSREAPAGGANPFAGMGGMGGMADMLRGMGGGGAGGMPDLASMMNNPQLMAAAQSMMANGGMERLMSNPTVANMVRYIHLS